MNDMNYVKELKHKIGQNEYTVGILGLGYVGLPISIAYAPVSAKVIGFDINENYIDMLMKGKSYIDHIPDSDIKSCLDHGFEATIDFKRISECDAILICVPTPLNKNREPDLSYVMSTMETISPYLRKGQLLSLESTTYPGTTDEELGAIVRKLGFEIGADFFLVYSPEREDPGNPKFTTRTIPKICGGVTPNCKEVGTQLYSKIVEQVVPVSSTRTAELVKLLENIHRAVNIGLVNEMKIVADSMGVDIFEVINAAATKPFGFTPYYPGPGLGGHCIPIDPFYLTWKAREYNLSTKFIELAGEINANMPQWVMSKVIEGLNDRQKAVNSSKVLVLGIAYKKNVDDPRESPSFELIHELEERKAIVDFSDPYINEMPTMRHWNFKPRKSVSLNPETLKTYDCVLLATDHDSFDYMMIYEYSNFIVDTRGRFSADKEKVIRA